MVGLRLLVLLLLLNMFDVCVFQTNITKQSQYYCNTHDIGDSMLNDNHGYTPSPPTKSLGFGGFDSSKLLIIRGWTSHVRLIL